MRPILPTCEMQYPTLQRMSLQAVVDVLKTAPIRKSQCAVAQLPRFGSAAVQPLLMMLRLDKAEVRYNATAGLSSLRDLALSAVPAIQSRLDDSNAQVRWGALNALAVIGPRSRQLAQDLLYRLDQMPVSSLDGEALVYTISSLGSLPPEALPVLIRTLDKIPPYDRPAANATIEAISHVGSLQRIETLATLIGGSDSERSWHATVAVSRSGIFAVPVLALGGRTAISKQRRKAFNRALDRAWQVAAVPALFTALRDANPLAQCPVSVY